MTEVVLPTTSFRLVLFIIFLMLVCLRMPDILLQQRLWAEEGLFYQNAWYMPAWQALFHGYGGYLNIVANAAGVIARYAVPVADAPLVSTGIGLLFQSCPALLILTSRATWLQSRGALLLAVLALATTPAAEEVWLQTLHSQNHLALCAALIVSFDDAPGPAVRWFRRVLLALAPLSGMLAVLVLPLMVARALFDRSRERTIQCTLLAVGALIQVGLFYSPADGAALGRTAKIWPGMLLYAFFVRHLAVPAVGASATTAFSSHLALALKGGSVPIWPLVVLIGAVAGLGLASLWRWRSGAPWLLAACVFIAAASYAGAINGGMILLFPFAGERYSFMPGVLLVCTVIAIAFSGRDWLSRIALVAAAWMIATGLLDYSRARHSMFASGPEWRTEVRRWEADPDYVLRLWPQGWYLQLTPDHSPIWLPVRPPELSIPVPHNDRML